MLTEKTQKKIISKNNIAGKNVSVLGMARSGLAAAKLLKKAGANIFVSDNGSIQNLNNAIIELESSGIKYETGEHTKRILDADLLVVSPGIPSNLNIIREAEENGLTIISELELGSWYCRAQIVAVTGTNGKTTTTTLIGKILEHAGKPFKVGGNIGTAFCEFAQDIDENSIAVLEVSSFQLDFIHSFHPKISILLNITPDHLDRYDHNMDRYIAAKCRIFENQTTDDYLIYNDDDEETKEQVRRFASLHVKIIPFSVRKELEVGAFVKNNELILRINNKESNLLKIERIGIRGTHNLYNAMAAALAAKLSGIEDKIIKETLISFQGVEHRLEFVREINGIKFINDSKATNVDSVWYAIQAFNEPLILILGGRDKGNDYKKLDECVTRHVKTIIAIGESAQKVYDHFHEIKPVIMANSMEDAVKKGMLNASAGDIVLLSPACASFDWFKNYEHRGIVFKEIVMSIKN